MIHFPAVPHHHPVHCRRLLRANEPVADVPRHVLRFARERIAPTAAAAGDDAHKIAPAEQEARPLTVALIDADGLRNINERHGHETGDRVLQELAQLLRENTRGSDLLLRSGTLLAEQRPDPKRARGGSADYYYWHYGTRAMRTLGGAAWEAWRRDLVDALLTSQRNAGTAAGSWRAEDPWGHEGGEVYTTALNAMSLVAVE